jgi:hypothetical protein
MKPIREVTQVTPDQFRDEIIPTYEPTVLRGLVAHWPAVAAAQQGMMPIMDYIGQRANDHPVDAILARPTPARTFTYNPGLEGFNFIRDKRPLRALLEQLWRYSHFPEPPMLAAQSALIQDCLPQFLEENPSPPLLPANIQPRIWMGNRATVPAHYDASQNLACVVAGRRRFTLFSPHLVGKLYIGPPDYAPTNAPVTVADLSQPNDERYPLLAEAMNDAHIAELEPGDAIYIPPLWFHQVEALETFNILVNAWWRSDTNAARREGLLLATMRLCTLAFRDIPEPERNAWRSMLDHFIFTSGDITNKHIPPNKRGLLDRLDIEKQKSIIDSVSRFLSQATRSHSE